MLPRFYKTHQLFAFSQQINNVENTEQMNEERNRVHRCHDVSYNRICTTFRSHLFGILEIIHFFYVYLAVHSTAPWMYVLTFIYDLTFRATWIACLISSQSEKAIAK